MTLVSIFGGLDRQMMVSHQDFADLYFQTLLLYAVTIILRESLRKLQIASKVLKNNHLVKIQPAIGIVV